MSIKMKFLSEEDKQIAKDLYKAHYTTREVANILNFSYGAIRILFRGFEDNGVEKYDRAKLLNENGAYHAYAIQR